MYRGWVFIGDGSPTTLCYYTVMPPNNYILGIFPGHKRIFTKISRLHPGPFCPLGHYSPFGPDSHIIARRTRSLRSFRSACYPTPSFAGLQLRNRRRDLRRRRLNFRLSSLAFIFAFGTLVLASLCLPSSSPSACWSSPFFARSLRSFDCSVCRAGRRPCRCIQIVRGPSIDGQGGAPNMDIQHKIDRVPPRFPIDQ
jgi:hypothetical protein